MVNRFGKESNSLVDVHASDEYAFRCSCLNDHLDVAQWLVDLGKKSNSPIDVHANDEFAFKCGCSNGHLHVARWLTTLSDKYIILNLDNKKINYKILR